MYCHAFWEELLFLTGQETIKIYLTKDLILHQICIRLWLCLLISKKTEEQLGLRNALADLQHTDAEESRIANLKATAIEAVKGNDFTSLRGVAHEFLKWDRSETFIRNEKGVYKIDIREINKILERHYGGKALLLPSGAGPTLVIHADEQEIADRAAEDVVGVYKSGFHSAAAYPAPIRSQPSIDDFVE